MAPKHLHDLFSAAYDGALGVEQAERFRAHLDSCLECAQAYDAFRTSIDAVRALPAARMPLPVHLPSDAPVAEQTLAARLRRLPRFRFVPGAATAVAALAAAAIIVLALNHPGGGGVATSGGAGPLANSASGAATACPRPASASQSTQALASFPDRVSRSDPTRPGQELVLATTSGSAARGTQVLVYAQLTLPQASAGAPNAAAPGSGAPSNTVAALPCLHLSGAGPIAFAPATTTQHAAGSAAAPNQPAPVDRVPSDALSAAPAAIQAFTVPPATPVGTVLHIVASIPANYPQAGDPPLTVSLDITVR